MVIKMTKKTTQKPELRKPERLDFNKGRRVVERVIKENREWLKEMADK